MSTTSLPVGGTLPAPRGTLDVADDGSRIRARWHPEVGVRKRALFQAPPGSHVAILLHVLEVRLRQRGVTTTDLNADADLAEVPDHMLAALRDAGLTPVRRDPV